MKSRRVSGFLEKSWCKYFVLKKWESFWNSLHEHWSLSRNFYQKQKKEEISEDIFQEKHKILHRWSCAQKEVCSKPPPPWGQFFLSQSVLAIEEFEEKPVLTRVKIITASIYLKLLKFRRTMTMTMVHSGSYLSIKDFYYVILRIIKTYK